MTITKRTTKGSALTYAELDENFRDLDSDMTLDRVLGNGNTTTKNMTVGRILQTVRPAFSIMVGQTVTNKNYDFGGTQAMDVFGDTLSTGNRVIEYNIGNHLSVASDIAKFTAPVNGLYHFNYMVQWNAHSAGDHLSNYLIVDSTFSGAHNRYYRTLNSATDDYITNTNTGVIQLTANQTVEVGIFINGDTSVNIREGTRFQGYLLS